MSASISGDFRTDAGMLCVWDPDAFHTTHRLDSWETEAEIVRHIKAGHLAPINVAGPTNGKHRVIVRVGNDKLAARLTERERKYFLLESDPYRLQTSGRICISGLEYVERQPGASVGVLPLRAGEYVVKLYLISWHEEPGMEKRNGDPKPGALPDFVMLVNPKPKGKPVIFRTKMFAMEPPK
ncbi:MAG TPA: hypothetical protein VFE62_27510 [Gemmataceae bacterium]|nr:hypothetical protein [Gemmataceae bacterium]